MQHKFHQESFLSSGATLQRKVAHLMPITHQFLRYSSPRGWHSAGAPFTASAGTTIACLGCANRRGAMRLASWSRAYLTE